MSSDTPAVECAYSYDDRARRGRIARARPATRRRRLPREAIFTDGAGGPRASTVAPSQPELIPTGGGVARPDRQPGLGGGPARRQRGAPDANRVSDVGCSRASRGKRDKSK